MKEKNFTKYYNFIDKYVLYVVIYIKEEVRK